MLLYFVIPSLVLYLRYVTLTLFFIGLEGYDEVDNDDKKLWMGKCPCCQEAVEHSEEYQCSLCKKYQHFSKVCCLC